MPKLLVRRDGDVVVAERAGAVLASIALHDRREMIRSDLADQNVLPLLRLHAGRLQRPAA